MKGAVAGAVLAVCVVVGAHARDGGVHVNDAPRAPDRSAPDWSAWTRPLASAPATSSGPARLTRRPAEPGAAEVDVVDARWMALTMWGEARGGGETGMRAVGHVIDNRTRVGLQSRYVTDTVSEAFQFSCWNDDDPNREALMNVDRLRPGTVDHSMWQVARRIAEEILAGRSDDPTGGALFYHGIAVSPRWSAGIAPTRRIGSHLFFRSAR